MATRAEGGENVTLIAHYSGKKLTLTVPTNAKVGDVVEKAAETLHLKREDLPLSLLYQGNAIDDTVPLDVSRVWNLLICSLQLAAYMYNTQRSYVNVHVFILL